MLGKNDLATDFQNALDDDTARAIECAFRNQYTPEEVETREALAAIGLVAVISPEGRVELPASLVQPDPTTEPLTYFLTHELPGQLTELTLPYDAEHQSEPNPNPLEPIPIGAPLLTTT